MDFVLLGTEELKGINAIVVVVFSHSFLWEKGVLSEDKKFDMTRDVQTPVIQKVDSAIQWMNSLSCR